MHVVERQAAMHDGLFSAPPFSAVLSRRPRAMAAAASCRISFLWRVEATAASRPLGWICGRNCAALVVHTWCMFELVSSACIVRVSAFASRASERLCQPVHVRSSSCQPLHCPPIRSRCIPSLSQVLATDKLRAVLEKLGWVSPSNTVVRAAKEAVTNWVLPVYGWSYLEELLNIPSDEAFAGQGRGHFCKIKSMARRGVGGM